MRGCGICSMCGEHGVTHRAGQGAVAGVVGVALVARLRVAEERAAGRLAGRRGARAGVRRRAARRREARHVVAAERAWLGLGLGVGVTVRAQVGWGRGISPPASAPKMSTIPASCGVAL